MRSGVIAVKLGMTSLFKETGERVAVTILKLEDCQIVSQKVQDKHGYCALVVGSTNAKPSKISKSNLRNFENWQVSPKLKLKEFIVDERHYMAVGTKLNADYFAKGQFVDIQGKSTGKGFQGAMKAWNFRGLAASHGVSVSSRSIGSTGGCQDPGRVFKNKKMARRLGNEITTVQNLLVYDIDVENNLIIIKGAVPGVKGSYVYVKDAIKKSTIELALKDSRYQYLNSSTIQ